MLSRSKLILLFALCGLTSEVIIAAELPRGFFVEDLNRQPPVPAFYNLETQQLQDFPLRQSYDQFIDFVWDREHGTVLFSARPTRKDPYRVYSKAWPDGEEKPIYENAVGPFRFLVSPDGKRLALQIMGFSAWPTIAVHDLESQRTIALGQGYSPDWSVDSRRLLYLKIPGALPSWLYEYRVDTDTETLLIQEPVMEAVFTDDPDQILVKTASQAKHCDIFQVWNRRKQRFTPFCLPEGALDKKKCPLQREIGVFPGHQFFFFKEAASTSENDQARLVVTDVWGGRLQTLDPDDWKPSATAVEDTSLVVGEDPLYVLRADGTGGSREIPHAGFIRVRR